MMTGSPTNQSRGRDAEDLVCTYLQQQGLQLSMRNYRSPFGEIDLIMQERNTLVFVEVRYRANTRFGTPAETVDANKQARLRATAEHFLQNTPRASRKACRFDMVAITGDGKNGNLSWLKNVF
jgi:putative endonuclease